MPLPATAAVMIHPDKDGAVGSVAAFITAREAVVFVMAAPFAHAAIVTPAGKRHAAPVNPAAAARSLSFTDWYPEQAHDGRRLIPFC